MSKRELKDLGPTLHITRRIETLLKDNLDQLNELLKDHNELMKSILDISVCIGNDIFQEQIDKLIDDDYHGNDKAQLLQVVHKLGSLIYGDHQLIEREVIKYIGEDEEYGDKLRNEIEHKVFEMTDIDPLGNIE